MGQLPVFATAPRIKLYTNNKPVAFAIGFNIQVSVEVQDVYVIGQYGPISSEPTMYNLVTGTMQIQRLIGQTTQTQLNAIADAQTQLTGQQGKRSVANFADISQGGEQTAPTGDNTNSILLNSELSAHLDPTRVLLSQAFSMKVFLKVPKLSGGAFVPAGDPLPLVEKEWMEIQGVRISSENTNISMSQIVNVPVSFKGLLVTPSVTGINKFALDSLVKQGVVPGQ